jgi:hypothetical protein
MTQDHLRFRWDTRAIGHSSRSAAHGPWHRLNAKRIAAHTIAAIAVGASIPAALAQDQQHQGERPESSPGFVREVRQATQRFQDARAATAEGYVSTGSCASGPDQGAMGVHYVNEAFIADGILDVQRPEVLVYEPHDGQLRLAAVEFFVDAKQWDAANTAPPALGGQLFNYAGAPNRLRVPAYYQLHVWAWKRNSSGVFSDWNPGVSCATYTGETAGQGSGHSGH